MLSSRGVERQAGEALPDGIPSEEHNPAKLINRVISPQAEENGRRKCLRSFDDYLLC